MKKLLITGGGGFMGRNLARLFSSNEEYDVFAPSRQELDLLNFDQLKKTIEPLEPDVIIHAAIKGGTVVDNDTLQTAADNITMYENLIASTPEHVPIYIIGSGAEYDRSKDIDCVTCSELNSRFPLDPYGLSKNIIARKTLDDKNSFLFRLFGCFNYDEEPFRFIKKCILNIKENKPIEIIQDRMMDFFYMDDVYNILDYSISKYELKSHMNLVYNDKYSLLDIAYLLLAITKKKNHPIVIKEQGRGLSYTGDGFDLNTTINLINGELKLIGLEEGIYQTCKKLL